MATLTLDVVSRRPHCCQVATGSLMLAEQDRGRGLDVRFRNQIPQHEGMAESMIPVLLADYDGMRLVYDLDDTYWDPVRMGELVDGCDLYFKRSFSASENARKLTAAQCAKVRPFGLYYATDWPGSPYDWGRLPFYRRGPRAVLSPILRVLRGRFMPCVFEADPDEVGRPLRVCFATRLWDPSEVSREFRADRNSINRMRVSCVRALRKEFGDRYLGGVQDSAFARATCPDLILPNHATKRIRYLREMRRAAVCVATTGLLSSTGGKVGEFVAASRAFVTEPLCYEVPGNLKAGTNYLEFTTPEQCVERVTWLLEHPDEARAMRHANHAYYESYLRPDALVARTLAMADELRGA